MKLKTATIFLIAWAGVSAQTVKGFYTTPISGFEGGNLTMVNILQNYEIPAGENVVWDFTNLSENGSSGESISPATNAVLQNFPGTTTRVSLWHSANPVSQNFDLFLNISEGTEYFTGLVLQDITLNYGVNNGLIGSFPLNYGDAGTDTTTGTFITSGASGTFMGSINVSVDGYGTFNCVLSGLANIASPNTSRLKVEQNVNLYIDGEDAGNLSIVFYIYTAPIAGSTYDEVLFKSTNYSLTIPSLNLSNEFSVHEVYASVLGTDTFSPEKLTIAPNPVTDVLHFAGDAQITKVTVTDAAGRQVVQSAAANDVNVSGLSAGVYYVTAQTANGVATQKIVKQ